MAGVLEAQPRQDAPGGTGPPGNAAESRNMRQVGHDDLQARSAYKGHVQEQNGRFIAYVGHHEGSALNPLTGTVEPNGNSIVDVTDPKNPVYLHHLPATVGSGARSLQTCAGDDLPNADPGTYFLHRETGNQAHEVWDVTDPSNPEFVVTIVDDLDGTHKNWWECDTGIAYLNVDIPGWHSNRHLQIFDLSDPHDPVFIRNYGLPGTQPFEDPTGLRLTGIHEPLVLDGRVYLAHGTGSDGILQILDRDKLLEGDPDDPFDPHNPTNEQLLFPVISRFDTPSYMGVHTAFPLLGVELPEYEGFEEGTPRDFVAVINESTSNECGESMHQMMFLLDITEVEQPMPVSNYQVPESEGGFCSRGGRFGAHSSNWDFTDVYYNRILWVSYFNAGVRGVDVRDPFNPVEIAHFIPAVTENTDPRDGKIAIQTNNVDVDDRGFVYTFDRANTGMHILEPTGQAKQIANLP
ncbi:MAG: hypothetical protein GEU81_05310 [Nitriliruptorales bacterium]|nr:hypothetical protein [Nitriliruptorales bacterium]